MAQVDAVFGGEHSAHYYFRDFWFADTGMLAAMHVLAALGEQDASAGRVDHDLRSLRAHRERSTPPSTTSEARPRWRSRPGRGSPATPCQWTSLDGLTVELSDGTWFNVRASNTEPLLRLNVEGPDKPSMVRVRDAALAAIRT